ncbi:unnamed protein product [Merluccius merluccius]
MFAELCGDVSVGEEPNPVSEFTSSTGAPEGGQRQTNKRRLYFRVTLASAFDASQSRGAAGQTGPEAQRSIVYVHSGWSLSSEVSGVEAGAVMWHRLLICCALFALYSAAPPAHINRLALFPDKSAWCEAKNITQIVGHTGCQPRSIQNRACLGQCFSYSVPNTFPQSTESLVHCDSCMPAQTQWEVVTLECPGSVETPHVDKLVERIFHCSCQSCSKEGGQEGAVMQLYPSEGAQETPSLSETLSGVQSHPHPLTDAHTKHVHSHREHHHTLPHTSDGG